MRFSCAPSPKNRSSATPILWHLRRPTMQSYKLCDVKLVPGVVKGIISNSNMKQVGKQKLVHNIISVCQQRGPASYGQPWKKSRSQRVAHNQVTPTISQTGLE